MPNDNCLAGFICPKCGYDTDLRIEVLRWVRVSDDGTEDEGGDTEWNDKSPCACGNPDCAYTATVGDFNELSIVSKTKKTDLPKLLSKLKTDAGLEALEHRLKGRAR